MLVLVIELMPASAGADDTPAEESPSAAFRSRIDAILDELQRNADFDAATRSMDAVFDELATSPPLDDKALIRDAAFARRLVTQLGLLEISERWELFLTLREQDQLGRAITFALNYQHDKLQQVYLLLERIRIERPELIGKYANLAAAICVVHDEPLRRRINENRASAADPIALFDYFVANDSRLLYGARDVPVELMIYIVDSTASIGEMEWALGRYAGNCNVGVLFFDIKYDYEHFRDGDAKEVTVAGWNLPNILRYGGVCADQAYFAVTVGKAIGVPTAYTRARSGQVGHAWVGFLQNDPQRAWWNFKSGRYAAYQGVRGMTIDPQTGRYIPDSTVSLLADLIRATELDRQFAAAVTDLVRRLREPVIQTIRDDDDVERQMTILPSREDVVAQLNMLESAIRACPGYAPAWHVLRDMAEAGQLELDDKKKWAGVLHRLCGRDYPDFEMEILEPMITSVVDVHEQNALWNAAFESMSQRADLAAEIRLAQAKMWREAGESQKAGLCCEDIINRYANAGPFVVDALSEAESILREAGEQRRIVALYERAWGQIKRPQSMAPEFMRQSNWYRVGRTYAKHLENAGFAQKAADVKRMIGVK